MSDEKEIEKGKSKAIWIAVTALVLIAGVIAGISFAWRGTGYIVTDNARVTTNLVSIVPPAPGRLYRADIEEGRRVARNEVIARVENVARLRSPIDGVIVSSNAVLNQIVSPHESVAVIADTANLHIQANIRETDVTRLQRGRAVEVAIDGFGSRQFRGIIDEIGHVTDAELAGTAMFFNTGGTFTRVIHLIPVKIRITDDVDLSGLIGTNARVRIPVR